MVFAVSSGLVTALVVIGIIVGVLAIIYFIKRTL
jgi:hypothetical protein